MSAEDLSTLITANHILHHKNVVDAYGHVSLRHPSKDDVFIMSGDRAPALVSSPSDLIEYRVSDASPVDPSAKKGYQERFIHSEIFKLFPKVNCVVHSHSEAVLPYTMNGVAMKPTFHVAGFLGTEVPVWDITELYADDDQQDMLVNNKDYGSELAAEFRAPAEDDPRHSVVLMANHGFTTIGTSIQQAVYRAVYTHINAGVQSNALVLRNASVTNGHEGLGQLKYLTEKQCQGSLTMNDASMMRPWGLWEREVKINPLYNNDSRA